MAFVHLNYKHAIRCKTHDVCVPESPSLLLLILQIHWMCVTQVSAGGSLANSIVGVARMGLANSYLTHSGPLRIGMLSVAGSDAQVICCIFLFEHCPFKCGRPAPKIVHMEYSTLDVSRLAGCLCHDPLSSYLSL